MDRRSLLRGIVAAPAAVAASAQANESEIVQIPNWKARDYQKNLWRYLDGGGKRAAAVWHRRAGKDDIALHWTAKCVLKAPGNYWHMLPMANQARKAIWDAVNPHTGTRRIDEAFPLPMRKRTLNNEMKIEFVNGSIWQVVGSDNYNSLVGSTPRGVVFSEWALAKPHAWAYIEPILLENNGWALFIYTPRGRNHGATTLESALKDPTWYAERLSAEKTGVFSAEILEKQRAKYVEQYGPDDGDSFFRQEYLCDFDAALVGAYYAKTISALETNGRIGTVDWERSVPVHTAWDLGYSDDTAIWFYQKVGREIRIIDYYQAHGQDIPHYVKVLKDKPYIYAKHWVPWDAVPKTMASPKSILQQLGELLGVANVSVCPNLQLQDGIQAVRAILPRCWFDAVKCKAGLEALRQYQREWDDDRKVFADKPLHNWASHPSDAFRYLAVSYIDEHTDVKPDPAFRAPTLNEAWSSQAGYSEARI